MGKEEEIKILSVQDMLHLQSDTHEKEGKIMPDVDTSRYVLNQKPKAKPVRNFVTTANITEEQRRQFNQGSAAPSRNSILAERARRAIEVAELNAEKEAKEHAKVLAEKAMEITNDEKKLANEIKAGNFEFGFSALTEGSGNLKEKI